MGTEKIINQEARTANSRFAKAGVSCFYDSEVLNSSFVHLMKFSAENPRLRKAAKRYWRLVEITQIITTIIKKCSRRKLKKKSLKVEVPKRKKSIV